jgi:MarR family transcriptional regulator, lower aerobic nicotinate degradation pathway regulator
MATETPGLLSRSGTERRSYADWVELHQAAFGPTDNRREGQRMDRLLHVAIDEDAAPSALKALPSWLLTQSALHAQRIVADAFAAGEARGYHYRLLAALEEFGPASQATLGRRGGIDRSDVVAALNELADQGYIERAPDPADRRRNIVSLTPAGRRQLHRLDELVKQAQDEVFAPLSAADRDELARLLTRVLAHHTGP